MDISDSDSAPEEENVQISALKLKKAEKAAKESVAADKRKIKEKRRTQHEFFSKQKELPAEILNKLENNVADESEDEGDIKPQPIKVSAVKPQKKIFTGIEKGPVTVKVVKSRSKVLAPKKEGALAKRDRFLQRRSIRRK